MTTTVYTVTRHDEDGFANAVFSTEAAALEYVAQQLGGELGGSFEEGDATGDCYGEPGETVYCVEVTTVQS